MLRSLNKRGMATWMVVSLVLALILLILFSLTASKGTNFFTGNTGCVNKGGICIESGLNCDGNIIRATCSEEQVCCLSR